MTFSVFALAAAAAAQAAAPQSGPKWVPLDSQQAKQEQGQAAPTEPRPRRPIGCRSTASKRSKNRARPRHLHQLRRPQKPLPPRPLRRMLQRQRYRSPRQRLRR